jgi:hypothetical protein
MDQQKCGMECYKSALTTHFKQMAAIIEENQNETVKSIICNRQNALIR